MRNINLFFEAYESKNERAFDFRRATGDLFFGLCFLSDFLPRALVSDTDAKTSAFCDTDFPLIRFLLTGLCVFLSNRSVIFSKPKRRNASLSRVRSQPNQPPNMSTTAQQTVDNAIASEYIVLFGKSFCRRCPSLSAPISSLSLADSPSRSPSFLSNSPLQEGQRNHR